MLEVCERFPKIGTIRDYQALPAGERMLYDQYTLMKLEEEAQKLSCPLFGKK